MISKNKEENQSFTSSNSLQDKPNFSQKINKNINKPISNKSTSKYKSRTPKNTNKKELSLVRKKFQFTESPLNIFKDSVKKQDCSISLSKVTKPFSALSLTGKDLKYMPIKTLGNYIKQKILDMSVDLGKNNIYFSDIENNNNCNISTPFTSTNKIIKKFHSGSGQNTPSHLMNKKEDKQKIVNQRSFKISINNESHKKEFRKKTKEIILRKIERKNIVYDSIDDSDIFYERDRLGFYISSDSVFALIFDSSIILCALFDVIYTPFRLSFTVCFCMNISREIKYIYYCIDLLYISDLVFNFFRIQYDEDFNIIKENEILAKSYFNSQYMSDFLAAIPIFSIISFLCENNDDNCVENSFNFKQSLLLFFCYFKQLKLIKVIDRKKNSLTNKFLDIISINHNIEKKINELQWTIYCLYGIYTFISIHIFIGHQSYPNWIVSMDLQNKNYFSLYITSFYFLMTTLSTVGYGDIVCSKSTIEICLQIIFLTVGVCIYSWIVSNIGNYIKNQDHAAIKCDNDKRLLEEIRIAYPEMPFKLYHQILKHLKSRRLRQQKCEISILINSLPYSLRNNLLLTMYKQTTNRLKICKNCSNSDFIIKLLNSFIPLFAKKNGLLIHEGELIESIVFVNDGKLVLEASIDKEFPENSLYQYLYVKFKDINEVGGSTVMDSSPTSSHFNLQNFIDYRRAESILDKVINSSSNKNALTSDLDETTIGKQVGKYDYGGNFHESNYKYINIINILKNESYGSVYMFLEKPSPLSLRVKSKKAELLLLRKFDAFKISRVHSNIWKRFQRKAYLNMASIKNLAIKIIKDYIKNNNILIQPKPKYISDITLHGSDNSSNNNKDFVKQNKNIDKSFSNNSSNNKVKTNTININKEVSKEQNNDFVANIKKVLNSKKNDNINENKNQDINPNLNKRKNKESNNELNKDIIKGENAGIPNITVKEINTEDKNNITKNNFTINKPHYTSLKNFNFNQRISGTFETNGRTYSINANTPTKSTNFERNQCISFGSPSPSPNGSKKGLTLINSGFFTFYNKAKNSDKKIGINGNEKMENISEFAYTFNSQINQEDKSSNASNIPLSIKKKGTHHKVKNSISSLNLRKYRKKNMLNNVGKIRLCFIRKLTKKIKKLKAEKKKYKSLSKLLTHELNEFEGKKSKNAEGNIIKNTKILKLGDTENKEIIYDDEDEKKNQISNQNDIINKVTLKKSSKFFVQIPKFSSSESDYSEEVPSNTTHSKNYDLNEISISSSIRFMCKSKYKNLNIISLGYYSKNQKLRKSVKNIIKKFLSIKKQTSNKGKQKKNEIETIDKDHQTISSKSESSNECPFHVYTETISGKEKKINHKVENSLQISLDSHNLSNDIKRFNSIHLYKKYKNDEIVENIINDNNDNENNKNNKNYYAFVVNAPKDQGKGDKNIIKLQNMNYLSISPSQQVVYSTYITNKEKNSLVANNLRQKLYNNTEYEYEHVFANNNIQRNLKKSYSVKEKSNLMKINNLYSFYIKNNNKFSVGKKMKIEDPDKSINNKNISYSNEGIKNGKGVEKSLINNNCYIF